MITSLGVAGRLARSFVDSKLTQLVVLAALLLGLFAILATPREEEPQIVVPFADVFVDMPGAGIQEVEQRVSIPLEKKLREIPGVEHVYSISQPGAALAIVRFHVGEDEERSMVKLHDKLRANFDLIPPGASQPLVKPRSIDNVPILALTLWSERVDPFILRRIAAELDDQVKAVPDVSETGLIGGLRRQLRVTLERERLAGLGVTTGAVLSALGEANQELRVGRFARENREYLVTAGAFLGSAAELGQVVVGVARNRPVHLRDVAAIDDGPEDPPGVRADEPRRRGRGRRTGPRARAGHSGGDLVRRQAQGHQRGGHRGSRAGESGGRAGEPDPRRRPRHRHPQLPGRPRARSPTSCSSTSCWPRCR
jgi:multidrug efflux pump subunit AcrB